MSVLIVKNKLNHPRDFHYLMTVGLLGYVEGDVMEEEHHTHLKSHLDDTFLVLVLVDLIHEALEACHKHSGEKHHLPQSFGPF